MAIASGDKEVLIMRDHFESIGMKFWKN
jgi:hypothetical protein